MTEFIEIEPRGSNRCQFRLPTPPSILLALLTRRVVGDYGVDDGAVGLEKARAARDSHGDGYYARAMSDTPDTPGDSAAEPNPWPEIIAFTREYVAKLRDQAAVLRGAATFRPREAARYQREALRLERMADAAEKSLE
jgi:hypothetical protein